MLPAAFPAFAGAASRLRAEALRRASAQAGRPLAALTYSFVRSVRPTMVALFGMHQAIRGLPFEGLRTGLDGPFGTLPYFLYLPRFPTCGTTWSVEFFDRHGYVCLTD